MKLTIRIGIIVFGIAMLNSCSLFKKTDYSDQTPIEVIPDEEMDTTETTAEDKEEETTPEIDETSATFLTYERSYCFGMCPVFKSEILQDGTILYEGINFVDNMGKHKATLTAADMDSIQALAVRLNYFELDSVYDNPAITDIPSVTTSVTMGNDSHTIFDRWKAPKELKSLYKLLDEIYARLEWTAVSENK